jgi:hypothetical protein
MVWLAKVLAKPKQVDAKAGTVELKDLRLKFYVTKVAKSKKDKRQIFGTMVPHETQESRKGQQKKYVEAVMDIPSGALLKIFDPSTYISDLGKTSAHKSRLMEEHVKEAIAFATCRRRYLEWLSAQRARED